jgi:D-amino-acid dehydrogenase
VRILWNTEALSWKASNHRIEALQTSQGELVADEYVLAAGSWTPRTLKGLRSRLPVEAGKGYSITLPSPPVLPAISLVLPEARVAVTPMAGALRFAGTMQFTGLDTRIEQRRVQAIIDAVPQYLPDFCARDFAAVPAWTGLRPCTPDGMPLLGRSDRYGNFIVATGHAMMGVSLAPATGMLVGELLAGRQPSIPLQLLRPERFERW